MLLGSKVWPAKKHTVKNIYLKSNKRYAFLMIEMQSFQIMGQPHNRYKNEEKKVRKWERFWNFFAILHIIYIIIYTLYMGEEVKS